MPLPFKEIFQAYEGTLVTTGSNNSFNPASLGTPDTLDFLGDENVYGSGGDVVINGDATNPVSYFFEQSGILLASDGMSYDYIIINAGGTLYMFLYDPSTNTDAGLVGTPEDPFDTGNQNELDTNTICFVGGSLISTEFGDIPVEQLSVGASVRTFNNGIQKISWIGMRTMSIGLNSRHSPIRIKANALGNGLPKRDLLVSPQHRILVSNWRAELMFGEPEVLVAAKHLVNDDTIRVATDLKNFEYFHIMFDTHQTIYSEGLPTESFHPGDMAMATLSEESRAEVLELFPELAEDTANYGPATHRSLKAFEAKALQSL